MREVNRKTFSCRKAERALVQFNESEKRLRRAAAEFAKSVAAPDAGLGLGERYVLMRRRRDLGAKVDRLRENGERLAECAGRAARRWLEEGTFDEWSQLRPSLADLGRAAEELGESRGPGEKAR